MFRDPLSMPSTTMAAPAFAAPRTPIHRDRCVTAVQRDPVARLAAAIRAATVDRG